MAIHFKQIRKTSFKLKEAAKFLTFKNSNGSVLKNPEISGALYTLRIQF